MASGVGVRAPDSPAGAAEAPTAEGAPCWDREVLVAAGYTRCEHCEADFGAARQIRAIVWHAMEGQFARAIARWNTGVAAAHLCILRTGEVVLTCPLEHAAWHAGTQASPSRPGYGRTAFWRRHNINPYSCGVELEGFSAVGFTDEQIAACIRVAGWLTDRFSIRPKHTIDQIDGHHLHSEISASRSDPGPCFPLARILAAIRHEREGRSRFPRRQPLPAAREGVAR